MLADGEHSGTLFVGHALLAFALAVLIAEWRGWPTHRAYAIGIATGLFAAVPDVDMLWTLVAVDPGQLIAGARIQPGEFWGSAHGIHRSMTHSLVAAVVAGPAFALWTLRRRERRNAEEHSRGDDETASGRFDPRAVASLAGTGLALVALLAASIAVSGFTGGFVMTAFVLGGLAIATVSRTYLGLSPRAICVAAVAGIASHPWGDLVTGEPPALFYPFDVHLLTDRVALSGDPTLHLLGAFAIEFAVVTLAAVVVARDLGLRPQQLADRRAALGGLYGVGALFMVPPTLDISYHFVFSILGVGLVCGSLRRSSHDLLSLRALYHRLVGDPEATLRTTFTALAGIAVALVSYAVGYLVLG